MNPIDYFIMKTPPSRMGEQSAVVPPATPGTVSTRRVVLSLIGLLLGIIASFFVTGLGVQKQAEGSSAGTAQQTPATSIQSPGQQQPEVHPFTWKRFLTVGLIAIVICGVTYQGLYFTLRLYEGQPTFLILFVSFQYGYFWQSIVSTMK